MLFYSTEQSLQNGFMLISGSVNSFTDKESNPLCRPLQISSRPFNCKPDPCKSDLLHHARLPNADDYDKIYQLMAIQELGVDPDFQNHFPSILQNDSRHWQPYAIQALPDAVIIYYRKNALPSKITPVIVANFQAQMEVEVPIFDDLTKSQTTTFCFSCARNSKHGPCMYINNHDQIYRLRFQDPKHPSYYHCLISIQHAIPLV